MNPGGADQKYVLNKILPVLEFAGRKTRGGAVESNKLVKHIYSMSLHFTSGSIFFAIAPDNINNSMSFRLSMFFNSNLSLASKPPDKGFIDTMVDNANHNGIRECSSSSWVF